MSRRRKRLKDKQRRHSKGWSGARARQVAVGAAVSVGTSLAISSPALAGDFTVTNTNDHGPGSLRNAMSLAEEVIGPDRILFRSGLSGAIDLAAPFDRITGQLEIVGPGADRLTIDGGGHFGIFDAAAKLKISGMTLVSAHADRGAVYVNGAELTVADTTFRSNYSGGQGGAVTALLSTVKVDGSRFTNNKAVQGGAISFEGQPEGGNDLVVSDSTFTGNRSKVGDTGRDGGAISATHARTRISGSDFSDNYAGESGGAIAVHRLGLEIQASTFSGNHSFLEGGAVYGMNTDTSISGSTFSENGAEPPDGYDFEGGAVSLIGRSPSRIVGSTFLKNHNGGGGGALGLNTSAPVKISNSTFVGNISGGSGGAIRSEMPTLTVESSTITGNSIQDPEGSTQETGAGILQVHGPLELHNSIVTGNTPNDLSTLWEGNAGSINASFDLIGDGAEAKIVESVPGSNLYGVDPQLGAIADNGGPVRTVLPARTSPVVNQGSSQLTTDARGLIRPVDFGSLPFSTAAGANGADIGAVELQAGPRRPPPGSPSNKFTFAKLKLNRKQGVATLRVTVPGAGRVMLLGSKTVKSSGKSVRAKSTIALKIKAKGKAARALRKKGKVEIRAKVRFSPTGGTAKTKSRTVRLVRKKHHPRR